MKSKTKKWLALTVLLLAHLLTIIDIFIVNIAIPSIQNGLKLTQSGVQQVVAIYMIGFASFLILGGKAGDHYGRRKVFISGLVFFMIFSAGCCFAISSEQLIASRFLQGVSAGFMSPQVLSYIQILFKDHKERTHALGWYGIAIGIGTMLGQFSGGLLVELKPIIVDQSWRYIFLINIPICGITIILATIFLKDSSSTPNSVKIDFPSAFILCIGLILLLFSVTTALEQSFTIFITLLISSILLLIYFIMKQKRKGDQALLNLELFRYKNFSRALMAAGLFMFMLDAYFFILAVFLQDALHLLPFQAGNFIVFQGLGFIFSSLFAPKLLIKLGSKVLISGVLLIIITLLIQLMAFHYKNTEFPGYIIMIFHGAGVALVLPSFANIALRGIPEHLAGNASGVYSTLQQLSGAFGIACTGGFFYHYIHQNRDFSYFYEAFRYSTAIHILCLTGVLIILIHLSQSVIKMK
ncbi:MFS transporter [Chryseobacterium sp. MYb264]|uniref:MFS transporter n=1 Tax=Chryseobacterium sp. MYb264 TaxID=2745153 RepID=UPI002E142535|nr:MFS transporter [Chryseobacterium sp. MYb264]